MFDILLVDSTNEIKATFFNTAVDKFFNTLEVGKVYIFSGGEVKKGSKFNTTSNPYEITFGVKTEIHPCTDNNFKTVKKFKFVKIGEIQNKPLYAIVDLIGVVSSVGESKEINVKTGGTKAKQSFMIRDDSNYEIEVNFWGEFSK